MHERVQKILSSGPWEPQRSQKWLELRNNMVTASDAAAVLGISRFDTMDDILYKKCGFEKRYSEMSMSAMKHGIYYEDIARREYERITGEIVHEVGLIQHSEYPFIGASADGVTESGKLIEIKCPKGALRNKIPEYYVPQIQLCLEVLDLETCDYIEYSADLNTLKIFKVSRDREWFQKSLPTIETFWDTVVERRKKPLCEIALDEDEDQKHDDEWNDEF
jgi:putative phage-type endonuclease